MVLMNDEIKLAKALEIGITRSSDGRVISRESNPSFYPFTDANDDYAVLEWMRQKTEFHKPTEDRFSIHQYLPTAWNYQIGDYARAALRVIE